MTNYNENAVHIPLITNELESMGFTVKPFGDRVNISLSRRLSVQEVEQALEQAFEDIEFQIIRGRNGSVVVKP